jgi:tetratricopeptide (TPR) repeat protein
VGGNVRVVLGICVFLAVMTWIVFGQTLGHEFINYDDPDYVVKNSEVTKGLSLRGMAWAFTHIHSANWHPLTTMSHMLDCRLYGLKAGAHHCTNVVLHTVAVLLLFLVLRQMTGALWRSAFVAALFAIHPLRVESVAWVAERKDVLSGVFFMLTLAGYLRYVRKPSLGSYLLVVLAFALGLMSKPMLVTLPFVLLLLDYWPLGRFTEQTSAASNRTSLPWLGGESTARKLILEKLPLLLLSAASSAVTFVVQKQAMSSIEVLPVWVRVYQAFVNCVTYICQMFWPARLAVFYPHTKGHLSIWPLALAIALLSVITTGAFTLRKERPYFITGWLWYLGMLVPVIGIIQVGGQWRADRYTYLPHIGLYLLVAWAVSDLTASLKHRRAILAMGAASTIVVLAWCASVQTSYWKNSESLWRHALAVTSGNATAHRNLGNILLRKRQLDEAILQLQASLKIEPDIPGHPYHENALLHNNLGKAFEQKGLLDEAMFHYRKAVELSPDFADGENNLGRALFREGQIDKAIACWRKTLSLYPDDADAHASLGDALLQKGRVRDAVAHYERSREIDPQWPPVLNALAWVLSTCSDREFRNGPRAIQLAEQANQLSGGKNPAFIRTLGAAYAESGRFTDAIDAAQRALELSVAKGDAALASNLRMDIDLYRMNFPRR